MTYYMQHESTVAQMIRANTFQ